ncbi:dUTP diphosphatase [Lysinibacillus sp. 2017]|uniref:dUTP diphosphatase n=1 Tax=unclassified Lysinibacillus TaxID=2636778 RepID=UPI000D528BA1|nr:MULTISPECIES: dUTP diphosphatase [unclassified Lysinibacillus]AWE07681.1 dUTP diphosphatase [Lysinibacillus sp. 2017]TGN36843.1 dUTP diphosphatase [Lysinibacillus sp. S2017]
MSIHLKIKKIHSEAILPKQARPGDAGMDLYAIEDKALNPGEFALIKTGIQLELPEGTEAQVRPRSGLALKYGITVLNSPGTIDAGYRGEVGVVLINHGKKVFHIEKHMRIAQLVIQYVPTVVIEEVDELSNSERGEQGFGSSGVK